MVDQDIGLLLPVNESLPSDNIIKSQNVNSLAQAEEFLKFNNNNNQEEKEEEIDVEYQIKQNNQKQKQKENAIVLRNIHKTYLIGIEGVPAIRGVSLQVSKGEFLIILGISGGGKTTMLNVIGTIDTPSRGDVKIFDKLIRSSTTDKELSSIRLDQVAFVFQSFNLFPNLTVLENVELPMKIKGSLSLQEQRKRSVELLIKVGLENRLNHFPNQLSGGEQQRVSIARALANNPKILLLDEPTGDLDTKNADVVMKILMNLNLRDGITMMMVTHDVSLKNYGNRVLKVIDGKINHEHLILDEDRIECMNKLKERLNKKIGIREGAVSGEGEMNVKTVYRKIADYKIKKQPYSI